MIILILAITHGLWVLVRTDLVRKFKHVPLINSLGKKKKRGRTGLVVRASDSGSGDPTSILGRVGVLFP